MDPPGRPTRRAVLTGGIALLTTGPLSACRQLSVIGPSAPDPDVVTAADAADRERLLLATYDAAARAVPSLAARLSPLRAEHSTHLAALSPAALPDLTASATPSPTVSPLAVPVIPPDAAGVLRVLRQLESETATRHGGAAVRCGRGLSIVLASAAASEASHVQALQ